MASSVGGCTSLTGGADYVFECHADGSYRLEVHTSRDVDGFYGRLKGGCHGDLTIEAGELREGEGADVDPAFARAFASGLRLFTLP